MQFNKWQQATQGLDAKKLQGQHSHFKIKSCRCWKCLLPNCKYQFPGTRTLSTLALMLLLHCAPTLFTESKRFPHSISTRITTEADHDPSDFKNILKIKSKSLKSIRNNLKKNQFGGSDEDAVKEAQLLAGAITAAENAAAKVAAMSAIENRKVLSGKNSEEMKAVEVMQDKSSSRPKYVERLFSGIPEDAWNYKQKGKDWKYGKCQTGSYQSPINLEAGASVLQSKTNFAKFYVDEIKSLQSGQKSLNVPKLWAFGDFFYHYADFFSSVYVHKTNKIFQLTLPSFDAFGVMIPTDSHKLYSGTEILFHVPSEHTFNGSGNRRHIEMQIWHSAHTSQEKNTTVFNNYVSNYVRDILNHESATTKPSSLSEGLKRSWQVLSLTFASRELNDASEREVAALPSERFIKSLSQSSKICTSKSNFDGVIHLQHPLNIPSLLLMLQLSASEFYKYSGSKTFPPCSEHVTWYVARNALPISIETMLKFYNTVHCDKLKDSTLTEVDANVRNLQAQKVALNNKKEQQQQQLVNGFPIQLLVKQSLNA